MKRLLHPFTVFQYSNFRWLTIGMFLSYIGSQMQTVGISWHLYQITHSAFSLGFIGLAGFLPILILSPISGVLIDAFDRRKVIIVNQCLLLLINGVFAYLSLNNLTTPIILYIVIFLNSVVQVLDLPARQTIIPSVVPSHAIIQAMNVNTISRQTTMIIGPAIAGYMIAFYGVSSLYVVNAFSFFVLLLALIPVRLIHEEARIAVPVSMHSILEGMRFIRNSPILYSTMLLDFFANFFAASTVIFPIFAAEILHIPTKDIGLLYTAPALGSVIVGLGLGMFTHIRQQGKLILWAVGIYGLATIGFGLSKSLPLSLFFLALVGGADMISMVVRRTVSQLVTPEHIRGRMNSINMLFFAGGPYLGEAEAGFAAGMLGAPFAVVIGGIGAIASVIGIAYWVPELTNYTHKTAK